MNLRYLLCVLLFFFFFFQAEDGIRDLVRSRGLGDVYKRQVQNLCIDHFRKNKQFFVSLEEAQETEDINPEDVLIGEQQKQIMEDMISRLKPEYAEVITLRYMNHYAYEEIANELNIPLGTVKTRLHRAKVYLAQIIEQESKK